MASDLLDAWDSVSKLGLAKLIGSASKSRKPANPGAPIKWSNAQLETAISLYRIVDSWARVAKKLFPDQYAANPKGAADRLRQAVDYFRKGRKAEERKPS